jgi:hypothetical protein
VRPQLLASTLELVADECHEADAPTDPFQADALYVAAVRANREIEALARRIRPPRSRWERTWARRYRKNR